MCSIDEDRVGVRDVKKIMQNILKFMSMKISMKPKSLPQNNVFFIHLGRAKIISPKLTIELMSERHNKTSRYRKMKKQDILN